MNYESEEESEEHIRGLRKSNRGEWDGILFWKKNDLKNDQNERANKCITFRGHCADDW